MLGERKILYTSLDYENNLMANNPAEGEDRFKKVMPRKLTLVMEIVDILVKVVDANSE